MELALKLFLCLFGFQFLLSVCKGALTVSNRHTAMAVVVGSKSTLTCSSDVTIQHTFSWVINSQTIVATNSFAGTRYCEVLPGYTTRYNVSAPSDGSYCNLIILNATMDEAGSYTCSDTAPQVPVMINLNVLNSGSNCSTSTDAVNNTVVSPENVTMYCSIQFGGWAPDLIWNPTGLTSNGTSGNTTYSTAYSTLNYNSNDATSLWPYKIPSYTCSVVYNSSVYVVTPISSCSTKEVNVLWCPRAINISGANTDESIKYGDLLTCSASGNPSPKYQWFDSANKSLATGPSLRVTEIGNYTCIASNNARSSQCSTPLRQNIANVTNMPPPTTNSPTTNTPATTTVTNTPVISPTSSDMPTNSKVTGTGGPPPMPQDGPCPTSCIIGIVVGVGGGLIIIIIIIIAVCCCKRKHTCCFKELEDKHRTNSTDNLTSSTAKISYNSHQNPAFDNVPPPYDNFHLPPENSVNFSIFYNKNQSQLTVKLIQAIKLVPGSRSKTAHPFARVSLLPERRDPFQSQIHPNTLSPQFDEEFSFQVPARQVTEKTVEILLFDANDDDRCMGQVHLPLDQVDLTEGLNSAWKGISQCEKKTQGYGGSMGTVPVNSPYSYEDVVPNKSQRVNGDPKSLYPNRNNPIPVQLKMDNTARSRQPLQGVEMPIETGYGYADDSVDNTKYTDDPVQYAELEKDFKPKQLPQAVGNYKETEYACVKIA